MPPPPAAYSAAELDLAHRARAGDDRAMARLYRRYSPRLYGHAVRMLGDEAAARDAVQEAFSRALASIGATREELHFRAWIYRIVTNLCLRQLNQRQRWSDQEVPERQDHDADDAERALGRAESGARVLAALDSLPAAYRQILVLRELDGLSYDDLARVLESDVSRVRVTLHRARARLAGVYIARRLLEDPHASVECPELSALLERDASEKVLVKHLEGCPRCRQRRHRPAAELLALLPAVEVPDDLTPPDPPAGASPGAAAEGTAALTFRALAPVVLGGAALVIGAVVVMGPADGPAPVRQPRIEARRPTLSRAELAVVAGEAAEQTGGRRATAAGSSAQPPPKPAPAKKRARRPRAPAPPALALKLQFTPGTLSLRRGAVTMVPSGPKDLRLGDLLVGKPGASFGLFLPRQQWLIAQGSVRLVSVPARKARPKTVEVALVSGQLRARATRLGGGVRVRSGAVTCQAPRGRFRVRLKGARLRVESIDAYVAVTGPHAARTVPPSTGLDLGPRPGFAHRLPPAPEGLRPVQACAIRPPRMRWSPTRGALGYRLQVATDTDFLDLRLDRTVSGTTFTPTVLPSGKYYWRVLARDGTREGLPSKIYSFSVDVACR